MLANSASTLNPLSGTLLVVYPLFEALPPVYGFRSSGAARPGVPLRVSMALSLLTAIGLAN